MQVVSSIRVHSTSVSALIIYDFALSDKLNSHLVVLVFDNKDDVEDELEVHLLDADAAYPLQSKMTQFNFEEIAPCMCLDEIGS